MLRRRHALRRARVPCALLLLVALYAGPVSALPADATYSIGCGPTMTGTLDAGNPMVSQSFMATDPFTASASACTVEIGLGDASGVPSIGPSVMYSASLTLSAFSPFNNTSLVYQYVVTPSPSLPVNANTLLVPLELIGIARARLAGTGLVTGSGTSRIFGSDFGGPANAIEATMNASGSCTLGQLGTVGGQPTCFDLNKLTAQVAPGAQGSITLVGGGIWQQSGPSANGSYFSFSDPLLQIDPLAEFAPGMRYADFFTVDFSSGVVNAAPVPEPGRVLTLGAALAVLVALRGARRLG